MWRRQLDSISGVGEGMRCNNRSSIASGSLVAELAVETLSSSYFANPGRTPGIAMHIVIKSWLREGCRIASGVFSCCVAVIACCACGPRGVVAVKAMSATTGFGSCWCGLQMVVRKLVRAIGA